MAQVRGTFPGLYDNVDKAVEVILRSSLKELQPIFPEYFNMRTSDRKFERVITVTPFGDVPEKGEGEIYALDLIKPAHSKDFTHLEFGLGFEHTETSAEDDSFEQISRAATCLAFSARYVQEKYAADVLNNGFGSETTPDGQPLFDAAHVLAGGGTAKNELTNAADLSIDSLSDALRDMQTETKIESGQLVAPITGLVLVVPPAVEFLAHRVVNSTGLPGSADNDTNPVKALRNIKIVVNPRLSDTDAWFLLSASKAMHGLTSYVRVPVKPVAPATDPFTGNRIVKVRFRQSWGAWMWQGTFASPGA